MELVAAVCALCVLASASPLQGSESDSSNPPCDAVNNSGTNCGQGGKEDATSTSNRTSSMCNITMGQDEHIPSNCLSSTDTSEEREDQDDDNDDEGDYDNLYSSTTPAYEYYDIAYYPDSSSNNITIVNAGDVPRLNESNSPQLNLSGEDIGPYLPFNIMKRSIISNTIDTIEAESLGNLSTNYNASTDSKNITNSTNTDSNESDEQQVAKNATKLVESDNNSNVPTIGNQNKQNSSEKSLLSSEAEKNNTTNESSVWWDNYMKWPVLRMNDELKGSIIEKREESEFSSDSDEFPDIDDEGEIIHENRQTVKQESLLYVDFFDSISEEKNTQDLNSTDCHDGLCDSNKGKIKNAAVPSNYDIKITEIQNEIVILQNEILESDPGETTTAAVWNTNRFIDRLRSLVPKNINKRDVDATNHNDKGNVNTTSIEGNNVTDTNNSGKDKFNITTTERNIVIDINNSSKGNLNETTTERNIVIDTNNSSKGNPNETTTESNIVIDTTNSSKGNLNETTTERNIVIDTTNSSKGNINETTTESNIVIDTTNSSKKVNVTTTENSIIQLFMLDLSLLNITNQEIGLMFPASTGNTTAKPEFVSLHIMNILEKPSTKEEEQYNNTSLKNSSAS